MLFFVKFDPQALLISLVVVITLVCGLVFATFWLTSARQKKGYQEIADFLQNLEQNFAQENSKVDFATEQLKVKIFSEQIDTFILPRTELPKNNLKNSLILVEAFIDSKKNQDKVKTTEGSLTLNDGEIQIKSANFNLTLDLNQLFYVAGFYDLQSKTLIFSLVDYQNRRSFKFQFLYFEDLNFFNHRLYDFKTKN